MTTAAEGRGALRTVPRGGRLRPSLRGARFVWAVGLVGCVAAPAGTAGGSGAVESSPSGYEALLRAAAEGRGTPEARRGLAAALEHRRAGRDREALDALGSVADGTDLSDWARLLEAEVLARRGDVEGVEAVLERIPRDVPEARGWRWRADALRVSGRVAEALAISRAALDAASAPADSAAALVRVGRGALALGDTTGAQGAFAAALGVRTAPGAAEEAASLLASLGPLSADDHLAILRFRLTRAEWAEAGRALKGMADAPTVSPDDVREAQLDEAAALLARGRSDERVSGLLSDAARAGRPELRARARLLAGRASLRKGRTTEAAELFERTVAEDPRGPSAQEALFLLGDLDHDAGRRAPARDRFRRAVSLAPESEWGGEAAVRLGTMLYVDGDFLGAASVFEAYRTAHPEGWRFQQAAFWAGLSYRRLDEIELATRRLHEAETADPLGYYGMRASSVGSGGTRLAALGRAPAPSEDDRSLVRGGLLRAAALRELGLNDAAESEDRRLRTFLAGRPGGLHTLGEALHEHGRLIEAVRVGREARRITGRWDERLLRIVFPFPFREEIFESATRWDVDPFLVAALVRQESLFQPGAVSPAGAVGLMQLLPRTARALATRAGLSPAGASRLRDPGVNLVLGSLHLSDLLRAHGGRVEDVLVAYNAGDGRLARWRGHPEYADPDAFLERIPYRETRDYVRTVRENAMVYATVYGGDASPSVGAPLPPGADERAGVWPGDGTGQNAAPTLR